MAVRKGILDERKKRARQRRIQSNAGGKRLRYGQDQMLQLIDDNNVPVQMQHCVLKVYAKVKGSRQDKYLAAFNICAANFEGNGFQKEKSMKLTSKGLKNNRKHQREKNAASKKAKFKTLTNMTWRNELKQLASE
jgi:hypothetical protein